MLHASRRRLYGRDHDHDSEFGSKALLDTGTSRRSMILKVFAASTAIPTFAKPSNAARGAAELDLEFYLRDLVGGNAKEGNILPSAPPDVKPARTLNGEFCVWFQTTSLELLAATSGSSKQSIQERFEAYQNNPAIVRAFAAKTPLPTIPNDNDSPQQMQQRLLSNQYYFDLTSYAIWKTATDFLGTNYRARDEFVRALGRAILGYAQKKGIVGTTIKECNQDVSAPPSLANINGASIALLEWFKNDLGLCLDYRIASEAATAASESSNTSNKKRKQKEDAPQASSQPSIIFDELDDESLAAGTSINPLITIVESATLGASLQLTGEQSRFVPDFLGPTLAALWEGNPLSCSNAGSQGIIATKRQRIVSWEAFFVDPVYRPNPKDYYPTEQIFQFTLANNK